MTKEEKISLITEQLTSGMTQAQFCSAKSIKVTAFRQWRYACKKSSDSIPKFVELIPTQKPAQQITLCIGRYRIDVPANFDKAYLRAVLESLPC
jgi:hypothetical protein